MCADTVTWQKILNEHCSSGFCHAEQRNFLVLTKHFFSLVAVFSHCSCYLPLPHRLFLSIVRSLLLVDCWWWRWWFCLLGLVTISIIQNKTKIRILSSWRRMTIMPQPTTRRKKTPLGEATQAVRIKKESSSTSPTVRINTSNLISACVRWFMCQQKHR